jgi:hypothetical protein
VFNLLRPAGGSLPDPLGPYGPPCALLGVPKAPSTSIRSSRSVSAPVRDNMTGPDPSTAQTQFRLVSLPRYALASFSFTFVIHQLPFHPFPYLSGSLFLLSLLINFHSFFSHPTLVSFAFIFIFLPFLSLLSLFISLVRSSFFTFFLSLF